MCLYRTSTIQVFSPTASGRAVIIKASIQLAVGPLPTSLSNHPMPYPHWSPPHLRPPRQIAQEEEEEGEGEEGVPTGDPSHQLRSMNTLLPLQTNCSLLLLEKATFRITADLDPMHPIAMNIMTPNRGHLGATGLAETPPLILPLPLYP